MTPTVSPEPTPLTYGRDPSIAKWTVSQYKRMIEEGIFDSGERVELLEGWIVRKDVMYHEPTEPTPVTYGRDPSLYKFTVQQYDRMVETGILGPNNRVELLENWVVRKMTHNPPHDGTLTNLPYLLRALVSPDWVVRVQLTLVLPDGRPEPDIAIAKGDWRTFTTRHPLPSEVGLVIEVADSSLVLDRRDKTRMYANAGIVRYWIVSLPDECIEVYEQPSGPAANPAYASVTTFARGTSVPLILDGATVATIAVDDVLP